MNIGFLVFPDITPLDALGPAQFLARVPGASIITMWKTKDLIATDAGFNIVPTHTFEECPTLDVLCVPGGFGTGVLIQDKKVLEFIRLKAEQAKFVTAVCTGSLVLGAAGLIQNKKATTHWAWFEQLAQFGALPTKGRVIEDGKVITGGGVTAGIDFGLHMIEKLVNRATAEQIQLGMEYDPMPPFDSGTPEKAKPEYVDVVKRRLAEKAKASAFS